jgi:NitT/TauT family transport system substrate-binding protein
MKRKGMILLSLCMVLMLLFASGVQAQSEPIKLNIGYSTWVGYGPLFIARDKGYFAEQGLDVTLTKVSDPKARFASLAGKDLDGLVTTLDTASQYYNDETPFKIILGLDESSGGDGIVVNPGISTIADLKGKKIGVNIGSVSQFFLEYIFQQNGMSDADVELVKMSQDDVPASLGNGSIDAGVTWEPNLSAAVKNGATLLVSSKVTPGLIVDILLMRDDVLAANPDVGAGLVKAWYEAVDYENANPDDGAAIMQQGLGGFYTTPDDIKADLKGATLFDKTKDEEFFSNMDAGGATATLQFAIDFYTSLNIITTPVDTAKLIDTSYVLPNGPIMMPEMTPEATP